MRFSGKAGSVVLQGYRNAVPLQKKPLPPREAQIARIVFQQEGVTAQAICDALGGELANASVRSMLQRLIGKGILRRRLKGSPL
jgi:predicted transcriptional regulator